MNNLLRGDRRPKGLWAHLLPIVPFALAIIVYLWVAHVRHTASALENEGVSREKVTPTATQLVEGIKTVAVKKDVKTDKVLLWFDTWASVKRFVIAYAFIFLPILVGLHMGVFPYLESALKGFVTFLGMVPPLALTAIIIVVLGVEETPKIVLVMVGVFPTVALSTYLFAKDVPHELIESALSRGASQFEIVYRIVLPVIWPKVLDSIRLSFMAGIQCLLAGEFMIASQGLGYRIYLMKRMIQMDMIIPYVLWMTLLIFIADRLVALWISKKYEWAKR